MIRVNLFDQNFAHVKREVGYDASCFTKPEHGEWVRNQMNWDGYTVFTDNSCYSSHVDLVKTDCKVAWLMESTGVNYSIYQNFHMIQRKFDKVLTFLEKDHAMSIGVKSDQYVNCPLGGAWVDAVRTNVKKTKLCSLIASSKNDLLGHRLRHEIAKSHDWIDLYGSGYKRVENKSEALFDYAFSVVIENVSIPGYFTEKLIDCMLSRTVPVYWGDPKINRIFEKDGILSLIDINNLSFERYQSMIEAVNKNFELSLQLKSSDDNVFKAIMEIK